MDDFLHAAADWDVLVTLGDRKARYFAEPISFYRVTQSGQAASEMHPGKHLGELLSHFGVLYDALNVDFDFERHVALTEGLMKNVGRLVESHCRKSGLRRLVDVSVKQHIYALLRKFKSQLWKTFFKS